MIFTAQDVISILSILATIIIGIRSFLWSRDYREAKQAELDSQKAGFLAKESEYKSQLETRGERIRLFELISDPNYVDKVEKIIDDQKSTIKKLQDTIQQVKNDLSNANNQIESLNKEITKLSISDTERSNLHVFTTGSSAALDKINETSEEFVIVEDNLEKNLYWWLGSPRKALITYDNNDLMEFIESLKKYDDIDDDKSTTDKEEEG